MSTLQAGKKATRDKREGESMAGGLVAARKVHLIEADLRGALLAEYDVDPEVCDCQLWGLLGELQHDGLIEIDQAASQGWP